MSAVPAEVVDAKTSVEVSQVEFLFMFCCDFGVPGDCSQRSTTASYAFRRALSCS